MLLGLLCFDKFSLLGLLQDLDSVDVHHNKNFVNVHYISNNAVNVITLMYLFQLSSEHSFRV